MNFFCVMFVFIHSMFTCKILTRQDIQTLQKIQWKTRVVDIKQELSGVLGIFGVSKKYQGVLEISRILEISEIFRI
jgi:hypothetical protein